MSAYTVISLLVGSSIFFIIDALVSYKKHEDRKAVGGIIASVVMLLIAMIVNTLVLALIG